MFETPFIPAAGVTAAKLNQLPPGRVFARRQLNQSQGELGLRIGGDRPGVLLLTPWYNGQVEPLNFIDDEDKDGGIDGEGTVFDLGLQARLEFDPSGPIVEYSWSVRNVVAITDGAPRLRASFSSGVRHTVISLDPETWSVVENGSDATMFKAWRLVADLPGDRFRVLIAGY